MELKSLFTPRVVSDVSDKPPKDCRCFWVCAYLVDDNLLLQASGISWTLLIIPSLLDDLDSLDSILLPKRLLNRGRDAEWMGRQVFCNAIGPVCLLFACDYMCFVMMILVPPESWCHIGQGPQGCCGRQ